MSKKRSKKAWWLVVAVLAALSLVVAACGDDDDDDDGTATAGATEPAEDTAESTEPPEETAEPTEAANQTATAGEASPTEVATDGGATGEIDPAILEQAFGTADVEASDLILEALARADYEFTEDEIALALECWENETCETGRGELTVALADGFGENVWREVTRMEFILQALTYPEVARIIYVSAQGDTAKAIADMQSLVAQDVDIIITFPDAGEAMLPTVREATEAGVIVVPYTSAVGGVPGEDYLTFISEDLCELGEQFAEVALREAGDDAKVVELGGTPGNQLSASWQACAEPALEAAGAELLGKADTNWTQEGTFQAMSAFLAGESEIDAVLYEYADGFRGGIRAYEQAGRPLDLVVALRTDEQGVFCDWVDLKADNPNFQIFHSNGGNFQSRIALTAGVKAALGEDVPAEIVLPLHLREVTEQSCNADLPEEIALSTLVPLEVLEMMFG